MNLSKPVSIKRIVPVALIVVLACGVLVPKMYGQSNVTGVWSTVSSYTMPINPVHVALLGTGKILVVAGSGNCPANQTGCPSGPPFGPANGSGALLLDPVSGTINQFSLSWDMFCNGMVLLPDGRAFIIGGTTQYDPFHGASNTSIFDPASNTFSNGPSMAHGRWYPTGLTLADGRIMAYQGLDENGATNTTVELYSVGSGWSQPTSGEGYYDLYPRLHLLPNGKVFYSGAVTTSGLFDPSSLTWTLDVANTNYCCTRTYGTSVLLPLTPANNYDPQIIIMGGNNPATATTETIDMGATTPQWQWGPNMSQPRIEMNAVILPSGKILAVGGSVNDEDTGSLSLNADLYDPGSNTFSSAGANATERLYHSVALLLPDATVWLAGGNPDRGEFNNTIEIYQPAYLFNPDGSLATRPSITAAPSSITYSNNFSVTTPDAANISSVVLVRNGTVTHAFGMDQRMVGMSFSAGSGSLTVTAPPNGNIAPPGYYMLFVLNSSGVPSQASFVQLGQQPDFEIGASPSGQTVVAGSNTSYTVNVTALGGFSGTVGLSVSGLPTGATAKFNPTTITGTGTSTLTVTTASNTSVGQSSLTITGTAGALSHQTAVMLTVLAAGTPTVTGVSPNNGPAAGGTPITIGGTNFVSGATATLGGTAATNVVVVNSTTITATTPAHAAGVVTVTVTNPDTQSGSLTNGYSYSSSGGGISFVQVSSGPSTIQSSNSSVAVLYGQTQITGDLNIVVVGWGDNSSTISSVTDSLGNTYSLAVGPTSTSGLQQSIYYAKNIAGGNDTVTVTFNQAAAYPDVRILEYSGLDMSSPLNVTAAAVGSGTIASSGAQNTTAPNELIFGAGTSDNRFSGSGSGFTKRIINLYGNIAEDEVVSSIGGYAATAINSGGGWVMQMATFKAESLLPAPTVTGVNPNNGPAAGGTPITISGTNFVSGATATLGGTAATNMVVVNSTTITATTAAHAAGAVTVTVTNPDTQSGSLANGYTYLGAAPTVTGVSPNNGPAAGGTPITISGTNFVSGATATLGGTAATNVVVVNSTTITATTAAHAAGAVTVTVTNPDTQSGSLANGYTYNAAPTVTGVNPNNGPAAGGTAITISGTNFVSGATATLGGTAATNMVVVNSTTITATTAAHAAGAVTVTVTNPDTQSGSLANGYTYLGAAPTVTGVSPNNGPAAGGTPITISGTNFVSGATATLGGTAATNVVVVNSTTITATTAAHAAGAVTVTITNPDTQSGSLTNGYTYNPAPTVTGVSPNNGPAAGGTAITISGTNFVSGATATLGGTGATNVVVVNSTTITATTAAHAAGAVTVTVTNPDTQSGSLTNGYTYLGAAPTVTGVSPNNGPAAGGTAITISGTNFVSGATATLGGTGATNVVVVNSTTITATTAAHAAGAVTVTVTNPDTQSGSLANGYTYLGAAPTVAGVSPNNGPAAGGTPITISGTNFVSGATATLGGTAATNVVVVNSTTITATTAAHAAGAVTVTVTNPDTQSGSLTNGYTYNPAPTVTGVSPNNGPAAGGTAITISGTNFVSGATATLGGTGATNVVVVNSTTITATTAAHAAGAVTVTVTNPDTQSGNLTNGYTYTSLPAPTVTGVNPNNGPAAGGTPITISGTNFVSGARATLGGTAATNVVVVNSTTITATTAAHAAGAVMVTVTNPDTQSGSLTNGYTYNPAPTVTGVSPNNGPVAGGTPITISGTNFVSGATATLGGTAATNVVVVNSTTITATTAAHAAGAVMVTITNPDTQSGSLTNGYTYNPAPTVTGVSPNNGPAAGGTPITISGTNFVSGATATLGGTAATNVVVVNSTTITATTAAHAAGAVTVTVTNPDTQSGNLTNGYTYTSLPAPTVTGVNPNNGPAAGGTPITISGMNFVSGARATLGGTAATNVVVVNSTTITATTAAHAAGAVMVTVTNPDTQSGSLTNGYTYTSTISFVQVSSGPSTIQSSNSSVAVPYGQTQMTGDLNIVVVGWGDNSSTISSVTDSLGNTYSLAVGPTSTSGLQQSIYYAKNIAGGSNTVTVTFNQAAAYPDVRILEYSGLSTSSPLNVTAAALGSGTSASSGSATTTSGNELIFGAGTSDNRFSGSGSGFTKRIINLYGNIAEDKVVSSIGSYAATAINSGGGWVMQMATFK